MIQARNDLRWDWNRGASTAQMSETWRATRLKVKRTNNRKIVNRKVETRNDSAQMWEIKMILLLCRTQVKTLSNHSLSVSVVTHGVSVERNTDRFSGDHDLEPIEICQLRLCCTLRYALCPAALRPLLCDTRLSVRLHQRADPCARADLALNVGD